MTSVSFLICLLYMKLDYLKFDGEQIFTNKAHSTQHESHITSVNKFLSFSFFFINIFIINLNFKYFFFLTLTLIKLIKLISGWKCYDNSFVSLKFFVKSLYSLQILEIIRLSSFLFKSSCFNNNILFEEFPLKFS